MKTTTLIVLGTLASALAVTVLYLSKRRDSRINALVAPQHLLAASTEASEAIVIADEATLSRGDVRVSLPYTSPTSRTEVFVDPFPSYRGSTGNGEWGKGWSIPYLRVSRTGKLGRPRFDDSDLLDTPFGTFVYTPSGWRDFGNLTRAKLAIDMTSNTFGMVITTPDNTTWTYQLERAVSLGPVSWVLRKIRAQAGDEVNLSYDTRHNTSYLKAIEWSRGNIVLAQTSYTFEPLEDPVPRWDGGIQYMVDSRISSIEVKSRNLETGILTVRQRYTYTPEPGRPWLIKEVSAEGGPSGAWRVNFTHGLGPLFDEGPVTATAEPRGGDFPTYPDIEPPTHSLTSYSRTMQVHPLPTDADDNLMFTHRGETTWRPSGPKSSYQEDRMTLRDKRCKIDSNSYVYSTLTSSSTSQYLWALEHRNASKTSYTLRLCTALGGQHYRDFNLVRKPLIYSDPTCKRSGDKPPVDDVGNPRFSVMDINSDGVSDVVMFSECIVHTWAGRLNAGRIMFDDNIEGVSYASQAKIRGFRLSMPLLAVDANDDGHLDVLAYDMTVGWRRWMNEGWYNGGLSFKELPPITYDSGIKPVSVPCTEHLAQLDGDGRIDMLRSCGQYSAATLRVMRSIGSVFKEVKIIDGVGTPLPFRLAGMSQGEILVIDKVAKERRAENEPCPHGTQQGWTRDGSKFSYYCSPIVKRLSVYTSDEELITKVSSSNGSVVELGWYWVQRQTIGEPRRALRRLTRVIPNRFERTQIYLYGATRNVRPQSEIFSSFAEVRIEDKDGYGTRTLRFGNGGYTTWLWEDTSLDKHGTGSRRLVERTFVEFAGVTELRLEGIRHAITTDAGANWGEQASVTYSKWTAESCPRQRTTHHEKANHVEELTYEPALGNTISTCQPRSVTVNARDLRAAGGGAAFTYVEDYTYDAARNLTSIARRHDDMNVPLFKREYSEGLLIKEVGPEGNTTTYDYVRISAKSRSRVVSSISTDDGMISRFERDPVTDAVLWTKRANSDGISISGTSYDRQGRLSTIWTDETGGASNPTQVYSYGGGTVTTPSWSKQEQRLDAGSKRTTLTFYDSTGSAIALARQIESNRWLLTRESQTERDQQTIGECGEYAINHPNEVTYSWIKGLACDFVSSEVTYPYTLGWSAYSERADRQRKRHTSTEVSYDPKYKRLELFAKRDGSSWHRMRYDTSGHLRVHDSSESGSTAAEYDTLGNIRRIVLPDIDTVASYELDAIGRPASVAYAHPRFGTISSTIKRSSATSRRVDGLKVSHSDGSVLTEQKFRYSSSGLLLEKNYVGLNDNARTLKWMYPGGDTPTGRLRSIHGARFSKEYEYYNDGRLKLFRLNLYDSRLRNSMWKSYSKHLSYNWSGDVVKEVTEIKNGNVRNAWQLTQENVFDTYGRLSAAKVNGNVLYSVSYDAQATRYVFFDGRVLSYAHSGKSRFPDAWEDSWSGVKFSRTLQYGGKVAADNFTKNGVTRAISYSYDDSGYLKSASDGTPQYDYKYEYIKNGLWRVNDCQLARSTTKAWCGNLVWEFDSFGRLLSEPNGRRFVWGSEGQIASVTNSHGTQTFLHYDEGETRIMSETYDTASSVRRQTKVGDIEIRDSEAVIVVRAGGRIVGAYRLGSSAPKYEHLSYDQYNSTLVGGDAAVTPYGDRRSLNAPVGGILFHGSVMDDATGLIRIGVRDYDPRLGRFAQPDPLYLSPQSAHRCMLNAVECRLFSYAMNDPVNAVDTTGWATNLNPQWYCDMNGCSMMGPQGASVDGWGMVDDWAYDGFFPSGFNGETYEFSGNSYMRTPGNFPEYSASRSAAPSRSGVVGPAGVKDGAYIRLPDAAPIVLSFISSEDAYQFFAGLVNFAAVGLYSPPGSDHTSAAFYAGAVAGAGLMVATGAYTGRIAAGTARTGVEFSHALASRLGRKLTESGWYGLGRFITSKSILNGNYVSPLFHALTDNHRQLAGFGRLTPRLPEFWQGALRVPFVYYGGSAGAGMGMTWWHAFERRNQ